MEDAHRLGIVSTADCENLFFELVKSESDDVNKVKINWFPFPTRMKRFLI